MKLNDHREVPKNVSFDSKNEKLRNAYKEMLHSLPTRYHLTLTFKYGVSERSAVDLLSKFLTYLNKAILKKRYAKSGQSLQGVIVKENTPSMENVHFHIMISDAEGKLPELSRMREIIEKKIEAANRDIGKLNQINKHLLQNYYEGDEDSSLEQYLTKIFERGSLSMNDKMNAICLMGSERVSFD